MLNAWRAYEDVMAESDGSGERRRHLIYFADPMCSWCYGFSPVIGAIARHFGDRLPVALVMGGLRAGNTISMTEKDRTYIRGAWTRVGEASGQPFDFSFFDRESFTYDTEPACRAVVTVRRLAPELTLPFKERVSSAFYAHNRDVTQSDVLGAIAGEAGLDSQAFSSEFDSAEARNETFRDFLTAQELGIRGFPTVLAGSEAEGYAVLTNGYRPLDGLIESLEGWLAPVAEPQVRLETPVKK
jgi:putative protein-disulfide isomerase